ncbi:restriction endonuclease subunit S [Streptococcus parasanguinis]|uniref:restriction endonuclease subunit S n=1 Tax=Streptococcus parasanguinis TaxID=1318 RepID=UPI001D07047F|nr:restriction endonuclease subunit S [Streptococcus parasanguinis]MCB6704698.1 restriction endonuclease subunit S [Streptococcus parasanguinis]MCB6739304.1 restriction endonuclease subunit S [Streptococcus parasanguinis]MCB7323147.1 restriction endonuclease subunit S [Streptococcus parasanguinis]MCB7400786.1 restriction endonuclease subunit S [Streptococcus parasanguinis]
MSIKKEKIPIVRFRNFSEPWLKKQLSEVAEFSKGRGYSKKDLQSHGTPIILYGRLYTNYESEISNVETYANLEENSVVSEGGEVIIPASGESADDISRASCVIDRGIILGGDLNIVRPHEYLNSLFIAITLSNGSQQRELSKRAQGKSVVHLHNSDLKAVKLFYPSYEEQSAIGSLFRTLDDLLTSHKDNVANYKSLKATMLSKMFPKAGQTVPEIRLDGFEGEWEINKLNKYLAVSKQKNTQLKFDKEDVLSVSGEFGIINQIQFQGRSFAGASVEMYSIVDTGNIVYTKSPLKANPYGIIKTNYGIPGIVSTLYAVYLPNENVFPGFVERYFENDLRLNSYLKPLVNKGAKNDMKVSDENALLGAVIFPQLEEQVAISDYFTNLDKFIQSHKDKITQLETLKKKLLQNMFI